MTTLETLEERARQEENGVFSLRIGPPGSPWLEVKEHRDERRRGHFQYKWGKNIVSRDVAINVLAMLPAPRSLSTNPGQAS